MVLSGTFGCLKVPPKPLDFSDFGSIFVKIWSEVEFTLSVNESVEVEVWSVLEAL